jgi:hypothetical protein
VRLPIRHNAWDAHHSETATNYQTAVLDREIAESLGLWIRLPSWDFHEPGGRRATISLLYQDGTARHAITWIRQDLLESWLDGERQALIWAVTGERGPLTLSAGFDLAVAVPTGMYVVETEHLREVRRAARDIL